jgi:hypothetical protein
VTADSSFFLVFLSRDFQQLSLGRIDDEETALFFLYKKSMLQG